MRTLESNGKLRHLKAKPIIIFYREWSFDFDLFIKNRILVFHLDLNVYSIDKIYDANLSS